jgi:hypothetical protein
LFKNDYTCRKWEGFHTLPVPRDDSSEIDPQPPLHLLQVH